MPPRDWATIRKFKDTTDAPLMTATPSTDAPQSVFGNRVYVSGQLAINETQGTRATLRRSTSTTRARSSSCAARRRVELTARACSTATERVRARLRGDLIVPNPAAVVRIVGGAPIDHKIPQLQSGLLRTRRV